MGNATSHPSNSNGPTPDQLSPVSNSLLSPAGTSSHGERSHRERRGTGDRGDRDRDAPGKPASPPPPPTPLLLPYGGHLSPQNPHCLSHPQIHDYSKTVVSQLILDQQLAPFYRGLDDFEENWTEPDVREALDALRDNDLAEDVNNSYTVRLKEERQEGGKGAKWGSPEEKAERARREDKAYLNAVECPICFLNYPPNINTSRCCQQPLCTECFVQIKRGEATITHLETEAACCPYCVESDFGVIYERPTPASTPMENLTVSQSALATSPDAGVSGFSVALSVSEEPGSGPVTPPLNKPPAPRRKSVSSKAKEVVTIDQIRPDWEAKLNAVKAAAARRAARRIVMRQVGDRLIPIGYTSSRATGQADFSMSLPPQEGRRERRTRERERELEEMMIMEAMRLSMIDHEEHQRKMADDDKDKTKGAPSGAAAQGGAAPAGPSSAGPSTLAAPQGRGTQSSTPSSSRRSSSAGATLSSWRAAQGSTDNGGGRAQAAASKLLSKITVNRSRANSKSSVHFAPSPTTLGASPANSHPASLSGQASEMTSGRNRSLSTPSPRPVPEPSGLPAVDGMILDSIPSESPAISMTVEDEASGLMMPVLVPEPVRPRAATTQSIPAPPSAPTAANPHPELAALMAEAAEDDERVGSPASKPVPLALESSTSDLISVSSLADTPPTTSRPAVPLSAMADDDD